MVEEKEKLLRLVNSSGFPFQLRVAEKIRLQDREFSWTIRTQEHAWRDPENGREGFIDLVIGSALHREIRMVLECKRTRDADWVFLLPQNGMSDIGTLTRVLWTRAPRDVQPRCGWHDFLVSPETPISEFCNVRGTGEKQKPMLENLCGLLLNSIECLAREELALHVEKSVEYPCVYIPVIVTNANLQVCRFKLSSVSLEDGEIPDGDFESVPYIRFSKSLSTRAVSLASIASIGAANRERYRTVLIVQASALDQFLKDWHMSSENTEPWSSLSS